MPLREGIHPLIDGTVLFPPAAREIRLSSAYAGYQGVFSKCPVIARPAERAVAIQLDCLVASPGAAPRNDILKTHPGRIPVGYLSKNGCFATGGLGMAPLGCLSVTSSNRSEGTARLISSELGARPGPTLMNGV